MLPPPFHLLQGRLVRLVPAGDHVLQVGVLCLDDFVSGTAMVRVLTGSTQLATGHGLHRTHLPFIDTVIARTPPSSEVTPGRSGRDCPRGRGTRSRALPTAASPAPGAPRRPTPGPPRRWRRGRQNGRSQPAATLEPRARAGHRPRSANALRVVG